jgi:hypothetical protein
MIERAKEQARMKTKKLHFAPVSKSARESRDLPQDTGAPHSSRFVGPLQRGA